MKQSLTAAILCFLPLFCSAVFASESATDQLNKTEIAGSQKVADLVDKTAKLMARARTESAKSEHEEALATCILAIEACDEALSLVPADEAVRNKNGNILIMCAMEQEAMLQHEAAITSCSRAIAVYNSIISKDHDNVRAYASAGIALEVWARAQEMMSQPSNAITSHKLCIACMDQALKMAPNYTSAYICKGNAFMASGLLQKKSEPKEAIESYTEAIEAFDKAINIAPDASPTYQHKAAALRQRANFQAEMGQNSEAMDSVKLCISSYDQAILYAKKPEPEDLAQNRQSAVSFLKALQAGNVQSIEEIKRQLLQQR